MLRILFLLILINLLSAQYVLDKGLYIGGNLSKTFAFLFESNTDNDEIKGETYRGDGQSYGLTALYKFDKRNFIGLDFNRSKVEIKHKSTVLKDSVNTNITEKDEFTLIRLYYVKKFINNPLFISGGLEAHLPLKNSSDDFIDNPLKRAQGFTSIGLLYSFNKIDINTFLSYSFPLSKYQSKDELEVTYGEFNLGLRIYFKLF